MKYILTLSLLVCVASFCFSQPCPGVNAGPDQKIFAGDMVNLTGTSCGVNGTKWKTFGSGKFKDKFALATTYTPGKSDIESGSVKLQIKSLSPAGKKNKMILTIKSCPTIDAGPERDTVCGYDLFAFYDVNAVVNGSYDSILWTTNGSGNFYDPYSASTTYYPSPMDIGLGDIVLRVTVYPVSDACKPKSDSILLRLNDPARVDLGEGGIIVCTDQEYYSLLAGISGTANTVTWSSSGSGYFDPATGVASNYYFSAQDKLNGYVNIYAVTNDPAGPCPAGFDFIDISTMGGFLVAMEDTLFCAQASGGSFPVHAVTNSSLEVVWTTNGFGYFDDEFSANTIYNFSASDVGLENIQLYAAANNYDGCPAYYDTVNITMHEAPWLEFPEPYIYQCASTPEVSVTVYPYGYAFSGTWTSSGNGYFEAAGSFSTVYHASKDDVEAGCIDLHFTTDDPAGPCTATSGTIWVCFEDCKNGLSQKVTESQLVNVYPNPAQHTLSVIVNGNIDLHSIRVEDLSGRTINCPILKGSNLVIDVEQLPAGMYLLHIQVNGENRTRKFIKQ